MSSSQVKPKSFLDRCITIISKFVERHDPLTYEIVNNSKVLYALCNANTKITMDGNPRFYLLKVKKSEGLYLHVDITIKAPERGASMKKDHEFKGISVQFLQGTGNLFCRAEWDVKQKDELKHPQPHWHWGYEHKREESMMFGGEFIEDVQEGGFMQEVPDVVSSLPNIDFEKMHYAMAAKWTSQDSTIEEFSPQYLYKWLHNCIANVIDQYNYQVNKGSFESSKNW